VLHKHAAPAKMLVGCFRKWERDYSIVWVEYYLFFFTGRYIIRNIDGTYKSNNRMRGPMAVSFNNNPLKVQLCFSPKHDLLATKVVENHFLIHGCRWREIVIM